MKKVHATFNGLLLRMKEYVEAKELDVVKKAFEWAMKAHEKQKRIDGSLFVNHPLEVAQILVERKMDVPPPVSTRMTNSSEASR